ncbi:hypothetical protein PIB30_062680 [Stylosanthes scabra]|uniref:Uncharacterized protein n=1 Tax=Stylosanthes scabra TaxID=79078 RepID=A0ABU6UK05_9FABA|nr:hypothetical protein [Stylosanthes scabra]
MRGIKNTPKNSLNYLKLPNDPNGESMPMSSAVPPSYWSTLGLQRGLALVRILEIPILAFINFLPDANVQSRGGERVDAGSALTLELTFDRAVARVRRAAARCVQNPPEWLPGYRAIARRGVPARGALFLLFLASFFQSLLFMFFLDFLMLFSIPISLKFTSKYINAPSGRRF